MERERGMQEEERDRQMQEVERESERTNKGTRVLRKVVLYFDEIEHFR